MNSGHITSRYAKALYQFAEENKLTAIVYQEMKWVAAVFENNPKLGLILEDTFLETEKKRNIILASIGKNVSQTTQRFINLILKNKRESKLQYIALKFIDIYMQKNNIHKTIITTASELNRQSENRMISYIESIMGGTIELEMKIDKSILGGFVVEVDSQRWDGSLANQLQRIRKNLTVK